MANHNAGTNTSATTTGTGPGEQLPAYTSGQYSGYQPDQKATYQPPQYGTQSASASTVTSPVTGYSSPLSAPAIPAYGASQTCTALYDYTAQAQGDLTFTAGSVIEIIDRTSDANGWWTVPQFTSRHEIACSRSINGPNPVSHLQVHHRQSTISNLLTNGYPHRLIYL
ncbi:hypothetical protein QCA50_009857 [Cerrena zonata]|uniref:SH3 domain-containing protein n=1 Tax=Cerrena zonata TaxID=2478898 RepID=A0AAW0G183_9APHY